MESEREFWRVFDRGILDGELSKEEFAKKSSFSGVVTLCRRAEPLCGLDEPSGVRRVRDGWTVLLVSGFGDTRAILEALIKMSSSSLRLGLPNGLLFPPAGIGIFVVEGAAVNTGGIVNAAGRDVVGRLLVILYVW
jgi:hypothetical protein